MTAHNYIPFDESLPYGERAQDRVADLLRMAGAKADKKDGKARYDFEAIFRDHVFRVEVKNEDNKQHTGNICLECWQGIPRRLSCLLWSEATVFVHTLGSKCVIYRTREMKAWLREQRNADRIKAEDFGDNSNRGFIVPITRLIKFPWFDWRPMSTIAQSPLWLL